MIFVKKKGVILRQVPRSLVAGHAREHFQFLYFAYNHGFDVLVQLAQSQISEQDGRVDGNAHVNSRVVAPVHELVERFAGGLGCPVVERLIHDSDDEQHMPDAPRQHVVGDRRVHEAHVRWHDVHKDSGEEHTRLILILFILAGPYQRPKETHDNKVEHDGETVHDVVHGFATFGREADAGSIKSHQQAESLDVNRPSGEIGEHVSPMPVEEERAVTCQHAQQAKAANDITPVESTGVRKL